MDEEIKDEVGISLNERCKELIEAFIDDNFRNLKGGLRPWLKRKITILVEKCIYSDNHD